MFIKAKLFALVLIKIIILILYLFWDTIYRNIKYFPPISWLKLISLKSIGYLKEESSPKVLLFPTHQTFPSPLSLEYYLYSLAPSKTR